MKKFRCDGVDHTVWCPNWAEWIAIDWDKSVRVFGVFKPIKFRGQWMNCADSCEVDIPPYCEDLEKSLCELEGVTP
jgi:hypothetical protein